MVQSPGAGQLWSWEIRNQEIARDISGGSQHVRGQKSQGFEIHFLLLAIFSFLILFVNLHRGDLSGYDDALYAHEAKEMVLSGDWWNIRFNGHLNFEYPPMFIWLEAVSLRVFGFNDFAAKAPSALLGFGTILLLYFLTRELSDDAWLPLLAMLVLMSTQYFMKYARHAMTDVPFTFFLTLATFFYTKGLRNPRYLVLCGVPVAFAVLTRSVIGFIPLGIFVIHLILSKRFELLRSRHLIAGFLLAFSLPLIWYISQFHSHGINFVTSHFSFIATKISSGKAFNGWEIILSSIEYPKLLLKLYWPWLPFMLVGLAIQLKAMIQRRDSFATLLVIWVVCIILPFSLAEAKVLRYIMPVFPAFAILSAVSLNQLIPSARKEMVFRVLYLLGCLFVVYAALFPTTKLRASDMRKLAPIAQAYTAWDQRILIYTYGETHWNYQNQFLWYGDRYSELLTNLDELISRARSGENTVVIIDKETFPKLANTLSSEEVKQIDIIAESERFVCFKSHIKVDRQQ